MDSILHVTPEMVEIQPSLDKKKVTIQEIETYANSYLNKNFRSSSVLNIEEQAQKYLPIFHDYELVVGDIVGKGSFSNVRLIESRSIDSILPRTHEVSNVSLLDSKNDKTHERDLKRCYVIKKLKTDTLTSKNESKYKDQAINQIIQEVYWLSRINHPKILQLRGLSLAHTIGETGLIFDTLQETLDVRLIKWRKHMKSGNMTKIEKTQLLFDQLVILSDLAGAIKYLHEQRIIHRDIKPANVGFDGSLRNHVKLFDFGIAREIPQESNDALNRDSTFKLTAKAGSFRYMAPEVANSAPYNFKADVFSFSVLLYEIFALKKPFLSHDFKKYLKEFHNEGLRPKLKRQWPIEVRELLTKGWAANVSNRPSIGCMEKVLRIAQEQVRSNLNLETLKDKKATLRQMMFGFLKTRNVANSQSLKHIAQASCK